MDYGNLFIVSFGIAAAIIGFFVVLLFINSFSDISKALAFLVALFGVITGLVGTYFGVKQSADAREGAESLAAGSGDADDTTPIITIEPLTETRKPKDTHKVTAIVTSVDKAAAANTAVTFTVIKGPDLNTGGKGKTDGHGRAMWSFTNNGTTGTDTIEATALGATGTSTIEFDNRSGRSREHAANETSKGGPPTEGTRESKSGQPTAREKKNNIGVIARGQARRRREQRKH